MPPEPRMHTLVGMRGEGIEIRGFGSFTVRQYRAYDGHDPRTGQVVEVKPKRLPHFKTSIELAARINQRRGNKSKAIMPPASSSS